MIERFLNKIFCGDARKLLPQIPTASVDAVVTDAMYGTAKNCQYDWGSDPARGDPEKHWDYHKPLYEECLRVLKPGGVLAWGQGAKFCCYFRNWFGPHRLWTLTRFRLEGKNATGHTWAVQTKERQPIAFPDRDALVIYPSSGPIMTLHPCPKPVEELAFLIESLTQPGQIVLDCFCGLGSTLMAAKLLARNWIGCDLSRTYCQVAMSRLAKIQPSQVVSGLVYRSAASSPACDGYSPTVVSEASRMIVGSGSPDIANAPSLNEQRVGKDGITVDLEQFTVHYKGQNCFLGNTIGLRLIARMAKRPEHYVSVDSLRTDVWQDSLVEDATIGRMIRLVRAKLKASGMTSVKLIRDQKRSVRLSLS